MGVCGVEIDFRLGTRSGVVSGDLLQIVDGGLSGDLSSSSVRSSVRKFSLWRPSGVIRLVGRELVRGCFPS